MVNDMNDPFVEYAQEGSQPMVVNDLDDLFPSTPKVATQDRDYSRISVSRTRVISREINASVGHQRPETVQGIAPSVKQSKGESDQTNGFLGSPHTFEAPVLPSNKAPIKTSSRHRPSQVRDPRDQPKGILKEPRGEKRSANVPDMRERDTVAGVKRLRMDPKTESRPTIADPQSPSNLRSGRNRKMSSKPGKKSTKGETIAHRFQTLLSKVVVEEKMMERFNQGAQPR